MFVVINTFLRILNFQGINKSPLTPRKKKEKSLKQPHKTF